MSTFQVQFLDDQGSLVGRFIRAWHAAAAERTIALTFGGTFHTATEAFDDA